MVSRFSGRLGPPRSCQATREAPHRPASTGGSRSPGGSPRRARGSGRGSRMTCPTKRPRPGAAPPGRCYCRRRCCTISSDLSPRSPRRQLQRCSQLQLPDIRLAIPEEEVLLPFRQRFVVDPPALPGRGDADIVTKFVDEDDVGIQFHEILRRIDDRDADGNEAGVPLLPNVRDRRRIVPATKGSSRWRKIPFGFRG